MAGNISNYLENKLLEHSLGKTTYTKPGSVWIALYTSDPTDADSGDEVAGGSYARQEVVGAGWTTASGGAIENEGDIEFPEATAGWGTITHVGIRDASTGGNLLWHGILTASKTVNSGDTFKLPDGALDMSLA